MDSDSIIKIIRQRRSVKPDRMRPDSLPRKTIETILETARWAPTHGLTEPWHFSIYQGEARRHLAATLQTLYQSLTSPDAFRPEKLEKLGRNPLLAPAVIVIGLHRDPTGKIPEVEEIAAVACAVQNMHLTASAMGLGAFWSSPPVVDTEPFRQFVGEEIVDRCLGLFYLGWPQEGLVLEGRRTPIEQKSLWHGTPSPSDS